MRSVYLREEEIARRTARNEAFWQGTLKDYPLMWITAPDPKPEFDIPEPATDDALWTDVDYVVKAAHSKLSQTYFAGDSLPVYNPWLGPDQFASWLGADLLLEPRKNTSWVRPFLEDWHSFPEFRIEPTNRWWKLYLEILVACAEFGKDKWITGYPDLHTGIDALCAMRGPENLMLDLLAEPEMIRRRMNEMTALWKQVVDSVTTVLAPYGQGYSNWTMGWSARKFLCIGQNDFTCMISPGMFEQFCLQDNIETCEHADYTLYHLDGPAAIKHLPSILGIQKLTAVQWVQGAGHAAPGQWLDLVRQIQGAGKAVQVLYSLEHALTNDQMLADLDRLLRNVDVTRLFIWADAQTPSQADALVQRIVQTVSGS